MKSGGCGNCDQNVTYERKIKKIPTKNLVIFNSESSLL